MRIHDFHHRDEELIDCKRAIVCLAFAACDLGSLAFFIGNAEHVPVMLLNIIILLGFGSLLSGAFFALRPIIMDGFETSREARRYRDHVAADNGRHVDPHQ